MTREEQMKEAALTKEQAMRLAKKILTCFVPADDFEMQAAIRMCQDPKELLPRMRQMKRLCEEIIKALRK